MLMRYVIATTEGYGLAQTKGNSQFLALAYDHIYELDGEEQYLCYFY
jgi:hypothetical protein